MDQNGGGGSQYGRFGGPYDRWVEPTDRSPLGRVQQQYWTTKQTLLKRLGKKEDEYVVASDSELDAKLELYGSVSETCSDLDRILGFYQDQLCLLSQEENSLGRFLKEQGKEDKTRAGKMMIAVGKTMFYMAQQRLALRAPLLRLHQEVETFHNRAVKDTAVTVRQMEKVRTEFRGTLMWMKDMSQQLDPDTYKQLEKFRKVQMQVKKNKQRFDKLKVDCLQKIDLLAASRCNMFSHALVLYQDALLQFWEKTARTMNHIADSFKGYQYYEFSVVKELCEPSRQLADMTSAQAAAAAPPAAAQQPDTNKLISFEADEHSTDLPESVEPDKGRTVAGSQVLASQSVASFPEGEMISPSDDMLLDIGQQQGNSADSNNSAMRQKGSDLNLLDTMPKLEGDDQALLEELLAAPSSASAAAQPGPWHQADAMLTPTAALEEVFGGLNLGGGNISTNAVPPAGTGLAHPPTGAAPLQSSAFMPSQLFGSGAIGRLDTGKMTEGAVGGGGAAPSLGPRPAQQLHSKDKDKSAWYSLFADLDPLANPDAVSHKQAEDDRTC